MQLVEQDTIKSVMQNISIILTTPKGSDPHRPDFASDIWQFIDKPLTAITVGRIKAAVVEAIETWEPRVKVEEVRLFKEYGKVRVRIKFKIKEDETVYSQEVALA